MVIPDTIIVPVAMVICFYCNSCFYGNLFPGFFVGKEGPMIHSGAIIGAGIPQFKSMFCKWLKLPYPYFRSDRYFASPSPNFTLHPHTPHMHTHHYHQSSHPTFHYPLSHTPPTHPPLICCRDKRDFVSSGAAAGVAGMLNLASFQRLR